MKTKMVEMNGQMVEVKVLPPSRRKAASSIQRRSSKVKPLHMDKKPGRDALSFVMPLVAQVQQHLFFIPIAMDELERRSILSTTAFGSVLSYMVETGMAIKDEDGIINGTITIR